MRGTLTLAALMLIFNIKPLLAERITVIRDIETESFIINLMAPILDLAKINKDKTKLFLIKSDEINAFVYNNQIFINSGLLMFADDINIIRGVLAHEIGHIKQQHLLRMIVKEEEQKDSAIVAAALTSIMFLGLGAAAPMLMSAIAIVPQIAISALMMNKLQYSRDAESEADLVAIDYLQKIHKPTDGLYRLMNYFGQTEPEYAETMKYFYTHPMPMERVGAMRLATKVQEITWDKNDCLMQKQLRRIQHKINGFNGVDFLPDLTNTVCLDKNDIEINKLYFEAHKLYKTQQHNEAIKTLEAALKIQPNDPFFMVTIAEILINMGKDNEAIEMYNKAISTSNNQHIAANKINILATAQDERYLKQAIEILEKKIQESEEETEDYLLLSALYGKTGKSVASLIAKSQYYMLQEQCNEARNMAIMANNKIAEMQPKEEWRILSTAAKDVIDFCEYKKNKKRS